MRSSEAELTGAEWSHRISRHKAQKEIYNTSAELYLFPSTFIQYLKWTAINTPNSNNKVKKTQNSKTSKTHWSGLF